jgi:hypothetical protein
VITFGHCKSFSLTGKIYKTLNMIAKNNNNLNIDPFYATGGTTMTRKFSATCASSLTMVLLASTAQAGNIGSDFDITMTPAAGGIFRQPGNADPARGRNQLHHRRHLSGCDGEGRP